MNRKWLTVAVLVCMLAAAALPGGAVAYWRSPLSCVLGFDSGHDATESRWHNMWSIPAAGGDATLLVGGVREEPADGKRFWGHASGGV